MTSVVRMADLSVHAPSAIDNMRCLGSPHEVRELLEEWKRQNLHGQGAMILCGMSKTSEKWEEWIDGLDEEGSHGYSKEEWQDAWAGKQRR